MIIAWHVDWRTITSLNRSEVLEVNEEVKSTKTLAGCSVPRRSLQRMSVEWTSQSLESMTSESAATKLVS